MDNTKTSNSTRNLLIGLSGLAVGLGAIVGVLGSSMYHIEKRNNKYCNENYVVGNVLEESISRDDAYSTIFARGAPITKRIDPIYRMLVDVNGEKRLYTFFSKEAEKIDYLYNKGDNVKLSRCDDYVSVKESGDKSSNLN